MAPHREWAAVRAALLTRWIRSRSLWRSPPKLVPAPTPLAVLRAAPALTDQMLVHPTEAELGLMRYDPQRVATLAVSLPFEPAMLVVARLAGGLWHIHTDGAAQLELARLFFDADAPIIQRYEAFVREGQNRVIFSEQQFFIAQRLLVDHARDGDVTVPLSHEEMTRLKQLIVGAGFVIDPPESTFSDATHDEVLAFLVQSGAYHSRQSLRSLFARAYAIFVEQWAADRDADRLPFDQWIAEDYALSLDEQMAAGQALQALSGALDEEKLATERSLVGDDGLRLTALRDRMDDVRADLAANREWYRQEFAVDRSDAAVVWDPTPFMKRPFLELSTGQLVLISPRAIASWLGDGFYYRLLDSAQRRNEVDPRTSRAYLKYVGKLYERWAMGLVKSVYDGKRPAGGGRVFGEQAYGGRLTSDVAIDLGEDLVVIEVRSGYLSRQARVTGHVEEFRADLERVLFDKLRRQGNAIAALLGGRASLPDVDMSIVRRVWPILVTANLTQSEVLYDAIDGSRAEVFNDARVQTPLILDPEDFEHLMGIAEGGESLPAILMQRQESPFGSSSSRDGRMNHPVRRRERLGSPTQMLGGGASPRSSRRCLGSTDLMEAEWELEAWTRERAIKRARKKANESQ